MTTPGPVVSTEALRALVREVLRDALPAVTAAAREGRGAGTSGAGAGDVVRSQADLDDVVRRVATLCEDGQRRAELRAGQHPFRLETPALAACPVPGADATPSVTHVQRGAVTERLVRRAAADGHRLVLGPRAVLTPLARDRARSLGVVVERVPADVGPSERKH